MAKKSILTRAAVGFIKADKKFQKVKSTASAKAKSVTAKVKSVTAKAKSIKRRLCFLTSYYY